MSYMCEIPVCQRTCEPNAERFIRDFICNNAVLQKALSRDGHILDNTCDNPIENPVE